MKSISGKKFVAILRRKGWREVRIRGSHHTYHSPDGERLATIPVHANQDLKVGMLARLLKDTGLTEGDL